MFLSMLRICSAYCPVLLFYLCIPLVCGNVMFSYVLFILVVLSCYEGCGACVSLVFHHTSATDVSPGVVLLHDPGICVPCLQCLKYQAVLKWIYKLH